MSDKREIAKSLLRIGAVQALQQFKVPQKLHMRVIGRLRDEMRKHGENIQQWSKFVKLHLQQLAERDKALEDHKNEVKGIFGDMRTEIERVKEINRGEPGRDGEPGAPGKDGENADPQEVIAAVLRLIEVPKGEKGEPGKDAKFDEKDLFTRFAQLLVKNRVIEAKDIRGLSGFVKDGVRYRTEELMHGGGSKEYSVAAGTITGTLDGNNKIFTLPFASKNWKVYLDGARSVSPADYSIAGTQLTCVQAPTTSVVCDN